MLDASLIKLGLKVLKIIIKLSQKDNIVKFTDAAFEIAGDGVSLFDQRRKKRELEETTDRISHACEDVLNRLDVGDARKDKIINDILEILDNTNLGYDAIVELKMDPRRIERSFLSTATPVIALYDEKERAVCQSLFHYISQIVTETASSSIELTNAAALKGLESLDDISDKIDLVLKKIKPIEEIVKDKTYSDQLYESHYRENIINNYSSISLLGANFLTRIARKYPLNIGYVSLELEDHNTKIDFQKAVQTYDTIWLRGEAGSGKSTLLQWLAVNLAGNSSTTLGKYAGYLPILIELKAFRKEDFDLKSVITRIMADDGIDMPGNWLLSTLESGKVFLLFDGVDEVKSDDRGDVLNWIEKLRKKYRKTKMIITSRPQIEDRIEGDITDISVLPMTPEKISQFIEYWHKAVLIEQLKITETEVEKTKHNLRNELIKKENVRRIASNPLLCAIICALHYNNNSIDYSNTLELYDDCCKMLLNRDKERDINVFPEVQLDYSKKKAILSNFAYWVMKNGVANATIKMFKKKIESSLTNFGITITDDLVQSICTFFIERSGLLSLTDVEHIDFIHRSFLEYLSACQIMIEDDWGLLVNQIDDESWFETIVLAMGLANKKDAEKLLVKMLSTGNVRHSIIAATCSANIVSLTEKLRTKIESRLIEIIPPHDDFMCIELSKVGDPVVPYLTYKDNLTEEEEYSCLYTLYRINTIQSLKESFTYLTESVKKSTAEILGHKLDYYRVEEMHEAGISLPIKDYLIHASKSGDLLLPVNFCKALSQKDLEKVLQCVKNLHRLVILDYYSSCGSNFKNIYKWSQNLQEVCITGNYEDVSDLVKSKKEKIETIELYAFNSAFDFYSLNHGNIFPKRFVIHTDKYMYFSGGDLRFLKDVESLELYFYNPNSEIRFDYINELKNLKQIAIYHPNIMELVQELIANKPSGLKLVFYVDDSESIRADKQFLIDMSDTVLVKERDISNSLLGKFNKGNNDEVAIRYYFDHYSAVSFDELNEEEY